MSYVEKSFDCDNCGLIQISAFAIYGLLINYEQTNFFSFYSLEIKYCLN